MSQFPYQFFKEFIVRTPLFSCATFQKTAGKDEISDIALKEICQNPIFQEAVYLASPYLHGELIKWVYSNKEFSPKEEKLKNTILKYYSRISTRCTPFGLFSGVGLGKFNAELKMTSDELLTKNNDLNAKNKQLESNNHLRDTKLDMHFLVALSQFFATKPELKNRLLYFPNNSIYKVGNKIRYVEYEYINGKRGYIISSAPLSEELQQILEFSKQGKTIEKIAGILVNSEITKEEVLEFMEELIDNQVLVSELEPNVSGNDFLETIISVLSRINANNETGILVSIQRKLKELDQNIGNPISKYAEIEELIKSISKGQVEANSLSFGEGWGEVKYLFQTDLYSQNTFQLSPHWKKELKKGISFLNKITLINKDTHLDKFKKAFNERFETEEVPLTLALDTEIGIGYRQDTTAKGLHSYLEDLQLPLSKSKQNYTLQFTSVHKILNEKVQEALLENQPIIELTDEDFKNFEENWQDLPDTISFMTEIISENSKEKLCIGSAGGSSAANLLGRFCSEKSEVQNLTKTITQKEEMLSFDNLRINSFQHDNREILAEIIHLPEARIGNVIRRPTLRQYEIPYLAQSVLPKENQISVDDLYISLQNDKIVLRSKKLNKEIKPYLTNAHNYYTNTLPVYHFLADLHSQNIRTGLYFDWGDLKHIYTFLPRVEYKNIILSKAWWKITEKDIVSLEALMNNKEQALSALKTWRNKRKIPQWIQWAKSDNTLPLNLENYDMIKLFIQTVKSEKSIIIEEFLYNENDDYKREFVFSMFKNQAKQ